MEARRRICVLGLGNLMRTDDAIGMMAVCALAEGKEPAEDITYEEGGTLGLDLMHVLRGVTHLLALDAVDVAGEPGTLVRFEKDELGSIPAGKSAHLLGFSDLIGVLKLMGDEPQEIVLLGVQPKSTGWGTELTDEVQQALPELLRASQRQLEAWATEDQGAANKQQNVVPAHA